MRPVSSKIQPIAVLVGLFLLLFLVLNFSSYWQNLTFKKAAPISAEHAQQIEQQKIAPNMLYIDSLSIEAPILYVDEVNEDKFQEALLSGVVHYPGTAALGDLGNAYIFGHSSDYAFSKGQYKTVFALLPKIKKGDAIVVSNDQGQPFVYKVLETKIVGPKDLSVLDQGDRKLKLLTLQTSYPLGTALKRFVVLAELP